MFFRNSNQVRDISPNRKLLLGTLLSPYLITYVYKSTVISINFAITELSRHRAETIIINMGQFYGPLDAKHPKSESSKATRLIVKFAIPIVVVATTLFLTKSSISDLFDRNSDDQLVQELCPATEIYRPESFLKDNSTVEYIVHSGEYREYAAKKLSGAVKIPTTVTDKIPAPLDAPEEWKNLTKFHWFLESSYPSLYENLKVDKINEFGLVYTWEGSDKSLKPVLLTAHQDTVPVDEKNVKDWKYPPFSGHYDGEYVWGRGSVDCKTLLVAILNTLEKLLEEGFEPKRGIVVALGFDEEIGGAYGASSISQFLQSKYGEDSFFALLDEGDSSIVEIEDRIFAFPSIGEKGSLELEISLATPGGHSSIPPSHTNIGISAILIELIENTPFHPSLTGESPYLNSLQCLAKYTDDYFEKGLKKSIFKAAYDKVANSKVIKYVLKSPLNAVKVKTTQAIDVIEGGIKANALPELTTITTNHRIAVDSSVKETTDKILGNILNIAKRFQLGVYNGEEEVVPKTANGFFTLKITHALEVAPVTPLDNKSWKVFSGVLGHVIQDYWYPDLEKTPIVSGGLHSPNTDTAKYWNLTKNIYRYSIGLSEDTWKSGIHSVNEHAKIDDFLILTAFNYEYIQAINEIQDDE